MQAKQAEPKWIIWAEWLLLLAIVAAATYLRYWRIDAVPPGFNSDEAVGAVGALTTLREGLQFSYEGQGGGGVLGFYFAAASFYLFGPSVAAIRGVAAWAGVVSIFVNYWAVREMFRGKVGSEQENLTRARSIAALATLGLAIGLWHVQASRIAFAGIGVPFLMLPSVYFLWYGLNREGPRWPFVVSGIFLGGLLYIYLSGVFFPPFYAAFFIAQWLILFIAGKVAPSSAFWQREPQKPFMTHQFWNLFATGFTATLLMLPLVYVLLARPELDPGAERASQAFFMNPTINQGDPWGLLWRSFVGNFAAYGISLSWLWGQVPRLTALIPAPVGFIIFVGFVISLVQGLRGKAAYLFGLLWFVILLFPSILAPDAIPHNLRTIGATTPAYIFAAITIVYLFEGVGTLLAAMLHTRLPERTLRWAVRGVGVALAAVLIWLLGSANANTLYAYFYIYPETNDAKAAYHVYAVEMAEVINTDDDSDAAYVLPRNTAAGDVFQNFTTDFLTEIEQPPAPHFWVIDNEETLADDLTLAAAEDGVIRVVTWKTSKHTGADPKEVIPYYLEKYGHYDDSRQFEYFDIDTYQLDTDAPDFNAAETLQPLEANFGDQLKLTGVAFGDAGSVAHVDEPRAVSGDLLWLRVAWEKIADHPENLKTSALVYGPEGQLITQIDKTLISNILQVGSSAWEVGATEETYFLIPIPPATPPGEYTLQLATYGEDSLARLPVEGDISGVALGEFTVHPPTEPITPDDLSLALPATQELLPGLTLVGFETLPGETVRSGQQIGASLIWQAGEELPNADLEMSLIAKLEEGDDVWQISEPIGLAGGSYPTSAWQAGEVLRGWLDARVPPAFEPGLYKLELRLSSAAEENLLTLPIGDFQVEGWTRNFEEPQPQVEIGVNIGDRATLLGADVVAMEIAPGETFNANLHWQVDAEFEQSYTAFVQLIGPDGQLYGQVDHIPGGGAFPTTGWLPGEYITDGYQVPLAADAPPGDYQVVIGMYDPDTGQRLPVQFDGQTDDKVLLPGLTVN